jgi:hypothetical protein
MAIQMSVAVRNARLDAIETTIGTSPKLQIWSGSVPANCAASATGTKLVEFTLPSDWAANAASGAKTFNAITNVTAIAGSPTNAGYYRIVDSAGTTCHEQGTVTATGGGGDMTLDNISIATGQNVAISSWTKTEPGA